MRDEWMVGNGFEIFLSIQRDDDGGGGALVARPPNPMKQRIQLDRGVHACALVFVRIGRENNGLF